MVHTRKWACKRLMYQTKGIVIVHRIVFAFNIKISNWLFFTQKCDKIKGKQKKKTLKPNPLEHFWLHFTFNFPFLVWKWFYCLLLIDYDFFFFFLINWNSIASILSIRIELFFFQLHHLHTFSVVRFNWI